MNHAHSNGKVTNGKQAFTTLGQFLQEDEWHPTQLDDRYVYRMSYSGKNGTMTCYAQIQEKIEVFIFYVLAPVKAPEDVRLKVSEFITRANYGLRIGNFELDLKDGEVRYKSSLDFENVPLSATLIKNAIYPAVRTIDRYLPSLMRVIYGGQSPEKAISDVEE